MRSRRVARAIRPVVVVGTIVGLLNLALGGLRVSRELRVLRVVAVAVGGRDRPDDR